MAGTKSAAPNEKLRSHSAQTNCREGAAIRLIAVMREGFVLLARFRVQNLATFCGISHMILLGIGAATQYAISPAQAATFSTLGPATHASLLVLSGTAAAFFAILAGRQSRKVQLSDIRTIALPTITRPAISRPAKIQPDQSRHNPSNSNLRAPSLRADINRDWSDLMARTSHDLRTPLNAVIGFTDVMHRELLGPIGHDRYREYIGHIRDASLDLLKSTEDTLAITAMVTNRARGPDGNVDLAELLDAARQTVLPLADRTSNKSASPPASD